MNTKEATILEQYLRPSPEPGDLVVSSDAEGLWLVTDDDNAVRLSDGVYEDSECLGQLTVVTDKYKVVPDINPKTKLIFE